MRPTPWPERSATSPAAPRLDLVAAFKPAYLIHGDDHGRIAERRARLREMADAESGANGLELFEGERAAPDQVAASLAMMTFAIGRRFLIVDGVERWKEKELTPLEAALKAIAPDTTVAFFAREDTRAKAPARSRWKWCSWQMSTCHVKTAAASGTSQRSWT